MDNRTTEILSRFSQSWTKTEEYFDKLINNRQGFERLSAVRKFISELKRNGEDRHFRLGASMQVLVISRSVDYVLRDDQKRIRIEAQLKGFYIMIRDGHKIYREYVVDDLDDIRVTKLLQTLKKTLVD